MYTEVMEPYPEPLQQVDRVYVLSGRRKLLYFAGCDYLRLASHPSVLRAAQSGLKRFGLSTAASRKTTGNHRIYSELEEVTAAFFRAERAVLTSSGYLANVAAAQGLRGRMKRVLVDAHAHRSLRESLELLNVSVTEFDHRSVDDLKRKLGGRFAAGETLVATDGVFASDGSVAPLQAYRKLLGQEGWLWVDDAHGAGVLGEFGRGTCEEAGVSRGYGIQTITFSKAFGTYGGAVLCPREFAERIASESAVISGNTPLPLPLAAGAVAALRIAQRGALLRKLRKNLAVFWTEYGRDDERSRGPQTPIVSFGARAPQVVASALESAGIFPPLIRYPGGPGGGYFRFAISSEHSPAQVRRLASVLREQRGELTLLPAR